MGNISLKYQFTVPSQDTAFLKLMSVFSLIHWKKNILLYIFTELPRLSYRDSYLMFLNVSFSHLKFAIAKKFLRGQGKVYNHSEELLKEI